MMLNGAAAARRWRGKPARPQHSSKQHIAQTKVCKSREHLSFSNVPHLPSSWYFDVSKHLPAVHMLLNSLCKTQQHKTSFSQDIVMTARNMFIRMLACRLARCPGTGGPVLRRPVSALLSRCADAMRLCSCFAQVVDKATRHNAGHSLASFIAQAFVLLWLPAASKHVGLTQYAPIRVT